MVFSIPIFKVFAIFLGAEVFTVSSIAREEFTVSVVIRQELLVVFVFEFVIEVVVVTG